MQFCISFSDKICLTSERVNLYSGLSLLFHKTYFFPNELFNQYAHTFVDLRKYGDFNARITSELKKAVRYRICI